MQGICSHVHFFLLRQPPASATLPAPWRGWSPPLVVQAPVVIEILDRHPSADGSALRVGREIRLEIGHPVCLCAAEVISKPFQNRTEVHRTVAGVEPKILRPRKEVFRVGGQLMLKLLSGVDFVE